VALSLMTIFFFPDARRIIELGVEMKLDWPSRLVLFLWAAPLQPGIRHLLRSALPPPRMVIRHQQRRPRAVFPPALVDTPRHGRCVSVEKEKKKKKAERNVTWKIPEMTLVLTLAGALRSSVAEGNFNGSQRRSECRCGTK